MMAHARTLLIALALLLTACAHGAKRVDCEAHLTAINAPTPKATAP